MDNPKKCADGKILMEETFGSVASSMSHLPWELVFGQILLPSRRGEKKKKRKGYSPGGLDTPLASDAPKLLTLLMAMTLE